MAGTLVWMADGTTKPIEQVKLGESVLSKNEKTGEVAAKKVTNTSVRQNIWTRKLSFEGGAVLETTDEHPLYVEGSGFVKAKEVGIGSSIVTRAGPSAKVVAVEADVRQAKVYNFTVDAFHTYFVGQDALWVHNADACESFIKVYNGTDNYIGGQLDSTGVLTFEVRAVNNPVKSGSELFDEMWAGISASGKPINAIKGEWYTDTAGMFTANIDRVNELTAQGRTLEDAISETWTAKRAFDKGYTQVQILKKVGQPGHYTELEPLFTKP